MSLITRLCPETFYMEVVVIFVNRASSALNLVR